MILHPAPSYFLLINAMFLLWASDSSAYLFFRWRRYSLCSLHMFTSRFWRRESEHEHSSKQLFTVEECLPEQRSVVIWASLCFVYTAGPSVRAFQCMWVDLSCPTGRSALVRQFRSTPLWPWPKRLARWRIKHHKVVLPNKEFSWKYHLHLWGP